MRKKLTITSFFAYEKIFESSQTPPPQKKQRKETNPLMKLIFTMTDGVTMIAEKREFTFDRAYRLRKDLGI